MHRKLHQGLIEVIFFFILKLAEGSKMQIEIENQSFSSFLDTQDTNTQESFSA